MEATTQTPTTKPRYVVVRLNNGSTTVLPEHEAIKLFLNS